MDLHTIRRGAPGRYLLAALLAAAITPLLVQAAPARAGGIVIEGVTYVVNSAADTADANPGNGDCADVAGNCSLRAAIEETNARPGADTITLPANTYSLNDQLLVEDSLTINGASRWSTYLNGNDTTQVLRVRSPEWLVCDAGNNSVASYRSNGQPNPDFLPAGAVGAHAPTAIVVDEVADDVFVATDHGGVQRFATDGTYKQLFADPAQVALNDLYAIDGVDHNGYLYVADYYPNNRVLRIHKQTGWAPVAVDVGAGGLQQPNSLAFYDDALYVTSAGTNQVLRYNVQTGAFVSVFVPTYPSGLDTPRDLVFNNNKLYVANEGGNNVLRYDAITGAFEGEFVLAGSGGLNGPTNLAFGPDGDLYVISSDTKQILRYDGTTGAARGVFAQGGTPTLDTPTCLEWRNSLKDGPTVRISGVTIENGAAPYGSIISAGLHVDRSANVALSDSAVRNNASRQFGGGIQNQGTLSLFKVEVRDNTLPDGGGGQTSTGGGIFNQGRLTIGRSLIAENKAMRGGGIANDGDGELDLFNSTISGNVAVGGGGGIRNSDEGVIRINASTITNNRANEYAVGGYFDDDWYPWGGGIHNRGNGTITMANTILAGNTDHRASYADGYSPDCYSDKPRHFFSRRDNLVGILTDDCKLRGLIGGSLKHDQIGTPAVPLDAGLYALGYYSSDIMLHKLHSNSKAVDADKSQGTDRFFTCLSTDQRDVARPQGARCDIGAFELVQGVDDSAPNPPITDQTGRAPAP